MPETTNINTANIGTANVGRVRVQRYSINTGDDKTAQSDALEGLRKVVAQQTDTLRGAIQDLENAITGISQSIGQHQGRLNKSIESLGQTLGNRMGGGNGGRTPPPAQTGGGREGGGDKIPPTVAEILKKIRTDLEALKETTIAAHETGGAGGGGEGRIGRAGGIGVAAEFHAITNQLTAFTETITKINDRTRSIINNPSGLLRFRNYTGRAADAYDLLISGGKARIKQTFESIFTGIQSFGNRLTGLAVITGVVTERFDTFMHTTQTGLARWSDMMLDFLPGLAGRPTIANIMKPVDEAIRSGLINPIGQLGNTMTEIGQTIYNAREQFFHMGTPMLRRMRGEEANKTMIALYADQRRANINADIHSSTTITAMHNQYRVLEMISRNTDQTVAQLVEANRANEKQIAILAAGGQITGAQKTRLDAISNALTGSGMGGVNSMLLQAIGTGGPEMGLAMLDDKTKQALIRSGLYGPLQRVLNMVARGQGDPVRLAQQAVAIMQTARNSLAGTGALAGKVLNGTQIPELFGEINASAAMKNAAGGGSMLTGGLNTFIQFMKNNGSGLALAGAMAMNTLALIENTRAIRTGGTAPPLWRKFLGRNGEGPRPRGGAGAAETIVGDIAKEGERTAVRQTGKIGGLLAKFGFKDLLKKLPFVGLAMGAGMAVQDAMAGDWTGAALDGLSGAARMVPGVGTAARIGLDALNASRRLFGSKSEQTPHVPRSNPQADYIRLMQRQAEALQDIRDLLRQQNDIRTDIRRNTDRIGHERTIVDRIISDVTHPYRGYPRKRS